MTVGQKASVSLLIAVLLFAAFAVAAFSGLFDVVESSFRSPALVRGIEASLAKIAEAESGYHASNIARFGSILAQDSVRRSFLPNLSSQDAFDRANLLGKLQEETAGLEGIRLIDANGKRLHFSTIPGDIRSKTQLETVYRNYGESGDAPYASIAASEGSKGIVGVDPSAGRFVYSLPFTDSYGIYRGSAVFQVSVEALVSLLVRDDLSPVGESVVPAGEGGLLFRVPAAYRSVLPPRVAELWLSGLGEKPATIAASSGTGESFVLFSKKVEGAGRVGYIVSAGDFALPAAMKWILLASFFVTAYLLAFLLLNIRQDRMTVLSDRIKRFQINLLQEYVENKSDLDFGRWRRELESRRPEVRKAIRAGLGRVRKNRQADVDELIDKSWDEILAILGGKADSERSSIGIKEIERLLGEALKSGSFVLPAATLISHGENAARPAEHAAPSQTEAPEEVEELGEAEAVEELESLEPQSPAAEETASVAEDEPLPSISLWSPAPVAPETGVAGKSHFIGSIGLQPVSIRYAEPEPQVAAGELIQPSSLRPPAPEAPEELEELEELEETGEVEELEELESVDSRAYNGRLASTQAYELASNDDDDIPLIPESSGLELADEADISDIIGFIDSDDAERAEELDLLEAEDANDDAIAQHAENSEGSDDNERLPVVAVTQELESGLEPLEEVEFELLLSSIDLSSLEQWDKGPAGAAEADATRSEDEALAREQTSNADRRRAKAEAQRLPIRGIDETEELEEFEELEELEEFEELDEPEELEELEVYIENVAETMTVAQVGTADKALPEAAGFETDDGTASDLDRYLGPWIAYRPFAAFERGPASEELLVVGEGEPWAEAEFLGEEDEEFIGADDGIIEYRDGVFTLNTDLALAGPVPSDGMPENPEMRALVDSVLGTSAETQY